MKINKINSVKNNNFLSKSVLKTNVKEVESKNVSLNGLQALSLYNQVSFKGDNHKFELAIPSEELAYRTSDELNTEYKFLDVDSEEFMSLADGDKRALAHLVKAGVILDNVGLKQDNPHNLEFRSYLEEEAKKGSVDAKNTLQIFDAQKGINGIDNTMAKVQLAKGLDVTLGRGFYPEDLEVEEFHSILNKMLDDGEVDEVSKILNQRTMVVRDGEKLKSIDYTEYFKDEFTEAAKEIEEAAYESTNEDFTRFLYHQAKALKSYNPYEDALADLYWADMQYTPLEFTITRESYQDNMTKTIPENEQLMQRLNDLGIDVIPKDIIGVRVGIVNKEGTDRLLGFKEYLPLIAKELPYQELYTQSIEKKDLKQTMVDADMVYLGGDSAHIRAGIVIAENLPNSDKESLKIGGGRRNVYHRQVRMAKGSSSLSSKLNVLLTPSQHKYYDPEAQHKFVIGHENMHSLGPKKCSELGKYVDVFEEMKANMGSLVSLDTLVDNKFYTPFEKDQILATWLLDCGVKSMPSLANTHRACDVIEYNYFYTHGAFEFDSEGRMVMDIEQASEVSKQMLSEIIHIQATADKEAAEKFVNTYFYWDSNNELYAENLKKVSKKLSGKIISPLADALLKTV